MGSEGRFQELLGDERRCGGQAGLGQGAAHAGRSCQGQTAAPQGLGFPRGPSLPQGVTRLLLTRIPFFKEIIVSSFSCDSCSWSNTEIQSAGRIQEQGVHYTLAVTSRQVGMASHSAPAQNLHLPKGKGAGANSSL